MQTMLKYRTISASTLKLFCLLCFLSGVLIMASFSTLRGSDAGPRHHVYELRLYHANKDKMDALVTRARAAGAS